MPAQPHIRSLHDVITSPQWRPLVSSRPLGALYSLRTVRPLDSLHTTPPVHLNCAGIVAASLAVVISHVVGPIKPSKFATAVGLPTLSSVELSVFAPVFPAVLLAVLPAIFLPHISGLSAPEVIPPRRP